VNTIRPGATASSPWLGAALPLAAVLAFAQGCAAAKSERAMLTADAEVFEAMVRAQISQTPEDSVVALRVLRVDSHPASDDPQLASAPQRSAGVDLDAPPDTLPPETMTRIAEQRKAILSDLHVEEGGPFNYPGCGGTRPHRVPDSSPTHPDLSAMRPGNACPPTWRTYVTVGLPIRGEAEALTKLRGRTAAPTDSSAELWTVLVTENVIGPAGQTWRQYACLLRRDPETGRLALAERFLISWAE
jgi:hypothetical protein